MSFNIVDKITRVNYSTGKNKKNLYIVIHYFGSLGSASSVANYFQSTYRGASAHFAVDEGETVYRCVKETDIAWHVGSKSGYKHPYCRNSNSIGIEVRPLKKSKNINAYDLDWYFSDVAVQRTIELTAYLMKKYNIPLSNVLRHYDVTGKYCPRPMVGKDINTVYKTTGDHQWELFKNRLSAYLKGNNSGIVEKNFTEKVYAVTGRVIVDCLNIRSGPGTEYSIVGVLENGRTFKTIAKTSSNWYKIDTGYYIKASKNYVEILQEDEDMITQAQFDKMMDTYLEKRRQNDETWLSEDKIKYLKEAGIMIGINGKFVPNAFVTRAELGQTACNIVQAIKENKI